MIQDLREYRGLRLFYFILFSVLSRPCGKQRTSWGIQLVQLVLNRIHKREGKKDAYRYLRNPELNISSCLISLERSARGLPIFTFCFDMGGNPEIILWNNKDGLGGGEGGLIPRGLGSPFPAVITHYVLDAANFVPFNLHSILRTGRNVSSP